MNLANTPSQSRSQMVWDPFVRIFHWSLVGLFAIAFVTEDEWLNLHSFAGYSIVGLLLLRVIWGVIGSHHARFSNFVTSPKISVDYLKSFFAGKPKHYLGHNPAGAAMILMLMLTLLLTALTGTAILATEGVGPLADTFFAGLSEDLLEDIHELLANLMLGLIVLHVGGVIVSSLAHRENLIRAMFNGRKVVQSEEKQ